MTERCRCNGAPLAKRNTVKKKDSINYGNVFWGCANYSSSNKGCGYYRQTHEKGDLEEYNPYDPPSNTSSNTSYNTSNRKRQREEPDYADEIETLKQQIFDLQKKVDEHEVDLSVFGKFASKSELNAFYKDMGKMRNQLNAIDTGLRGFITRMEKYENQSYQPLPSETQKYNYFDDDSRGQE
jgi:hypothetical protein